MLNKYKFTKLKYLNQAGNFNPNLPHLIKHLRLIEPFN